MVDLTKVISEVPDFKGTFIEDLFNVMQRGEFADSKEPVAEGEREIGELNKMEKALLTLAEKLSLDERPITARLRGEGKPVKKKEKFSLERQLERIRTNFKICGILMWESIKSRLASEETQKATGWTIRAGSKIVLFSDQLIDALGKLAGSAHKG